MLPRIYPYRERSPHARIRTLKRSLLDVGAATLCAAALAACGGDDDALSEEEFISQGNAICMAGNERIEAAARALPQDQAPSGPEAEEFFTVLTADIQRQIDELGDLTPPDNLQDDFDTLLADAQTAIDGIGEQGAEGFFASPDDAFADVNRQAGAIGLKECAGGGE